MRSSGNSEGVYANSNLLADTSTLPPPPDHWVERNSPLPVNETHLNVHQFDINQKRSSPNGEQMNASMTIRRGAKREPDEASVYSLDIRQSEGRSLRFVRKVWRN